MDLGLVRFEAIKRYHYCFSVGNCFIVKNCCLKIVNLTNFNSDCLPIHFIRSLNRFIIDFIEVDYSLTQFHLRNFLNFIKKANFIEGNEHFPAKIIHFIVKTFHSLVKIKNFVKYYSASNYFTNFS